MKRPAFYETFSFAVDSEDSKDVPPRRGGWHFEEDEEEEEEIEIEEDHGWISSWHKGKKKKGDIGSVFQLSVTFLAFLAFGGYLLCLIVQAVKGGGPTGPTGEGKRATHPFGMINHFGSRAKKGIPSLPFTSAHCLFSRK